MKIKQKLIYLGLIIFVLHFLHACISKPKNPYVGLYPEKRISIMAYNVENLFDTLHDENREDYTFLPLALKYKMPQAQEYCAKQRGGRRKECYELDWSEEVLAVKMKNLSQVIRQIYQKGPDILILEEVENLSVLKEWVTKELGDLNYQTIELIEGDDIRGIDVAIVSRFPKAGEAKLHRIRWQEALRLYPAGTRGILEVPLLLPNNEIIHVFAVHLPSQANPTPYRIDAVNTIIDLVKAVPHDRYWVVGGDWNITFEEDEKTGLVSQKLASIGLVSHLIGCKKCKGTYNYRRDWSFLDILVFSPNFNASESSLRLDANSINVPRWAPEQTTNSGRPKRFNFKKSQGTSDHFPIYGEIVFHQ